jgi:hypothetical protein
MRYLLLLAILATPVTLHGQERTRDETPVMAAAVRYMQRFYGIGVPGFERPPEHRQFLFHLDASIYVIERPEGRANGFSVVRVPRKAATQDPVLLGQLADAVSLDTLSIERAPMICLPFMVRRQGKGDDSYQACRFTRTDGVLGASLPIISGDTATVEIWSWVNSSRPKYHEHIREELWVVTLVRDAGVWRAVRHARGNSIVA